MSEKNSDDVKKGDDKPKTEPPISCTAVTCANYFTRFCKFMDGIKGRDKFSKIVQYGSRAIKHYLLVADAKSEWGQRFDGLYSTTATGRKLFRLLKSANEIETLRNLFVKGESDPVKLYLTIVKQLSFITYWFFDNIGYFIRAKFLKFDKRTTGLYGSYGWFVGSLSGFVIALYEYQKATAKFMKKYKTYKEAKEQGKDIGDLKRECWEAGAKRLRCAQDIVRYFLDVIVSGSSAELPQRVGLTPPHDGIIGILGALSAAINGYQIWCETK
jgi:peroxin-11B